jgi:hypothetical protein
LYSLAWFWLLLCDGQCLGSSNVKVKRTYTIL